MYEYCGLLLIANHLTKIVISNNVDYTLHNVIWLLLDYFWPNLIITDWIGIEKKKCKIIKKRKIRIGLNEWIWNNVLPLFE